MGLFSHIFKSKLFHQKKKKATIADKIKEYEAQKLNQPLPNLKIRAKTSSGLKGRTKKAEAPEKLANQD